MTRHSKAAISCRSFQILATGTTLEARGGHGGDPGGENGVPRGSWGQFLPFLTLDEKISLTPVGGCRSVFLLMSVRNERGLAQFGQTNSGRLGRPRPDQFWAEKLRLGRRKTGWHGPGLVCFGWGNLATFAAAATPSYSENVGWETGVTR